MPAKKPQTLRTTTEPFDILDSLGGHITGDYEKDLKRANKLDVTFNERDYQLAYQLDNQH
jgi:hypothetical protein